VGFLPLSLSHHKIVIYVMLDDEKAFGSTYMSYLADGGKTDVAASNLTSYSCNKTN